jgi:uncharacterized protein involved in response to NO
VLRLGFRPFYLGGALFGALAVAIWLFALRGYPSAGRSDVLSGVLWHVHEMVFGFVAAILVGFLLTAVRAWTGLETPRGAALAWLWLLWAAGRVLVWSGPEPVAAVVDSAFLPIVAVVLLSVLIAARNRRNLFLPAALGLFGVLNALFHWWSWQGRGDLALRDAYAALGLVVMFVAVIAGRVIPMFTVNAIPGFAMKRWKPIEVLAGPVVLVTFLSDALEAPPLMVAACACAAAVIHGARMVGWRSWRVGARPILWIIHVAYSWIPAGFAMLALAALGAAPHTLAVHAFSVGAIGCAIIAMITRTALGHTGRPLIAGAVEIASYGLMIAAGLMRLFGPWLGGHATQVWIDGAGLCWFVALALYLIKYVPYLSAPRVDGKGG